MKRDFCRGTVAIMAAYVALRVGGEVQECAGGEKAQQRCLVVFQARLRLPGFPYHCHQLIRLQRCHLRHTSL